VYSGPLFAVARFALACDVARVVRAASRERYKVPDRQLRGYPTVYATAALAIHNSIPVCLGVVAFSRQSPRLVIASMFGAFRRILLVVSTHRLATLGGVFALPSRDCRRIFLGIARLPTLVSPLNYIRVSGAPFRVVFKRMRAKRLVTCVTSPISLVRTWRTTSAIFPSLKEAALFTVRFPFRTWLKRQ
jgi:hypothetical protein